VSKKKLIFIDEVPDNFLSNLDSRDVALWIRSLPKNPPAQERLVSFLGLPWRLVQHEGKQPRAPCVPKQRAGTASQEIAAGVFPCAAAWTSLATLEPFAIANQHSADARRHVGRASRHPKGDMHPWPE